MYTCSLVLEYTSMIPVVVLVINIKTLDSVIIWYFVWTIFNERAYLTFKSIFHKALNLFNFDCEITLKSVPGTNQY